MLPRHTQYCVHTLHGINTGWQTQTRTVGEKTAVGLCATAVVACRRH